MNRWILTLLLAASAYAVRPPAACGGQQGSSAESTPASGQGRAAQLASEAQRALSQRDYVTAIRMLEQLVRMAPAVAESHANLGMAYYGANRFSDAAVEFRKALKLKPDLTNARYFLGLSLSKSGKCKQALVYLERDYRRVPDPQLKRALGTETVRCYMALEQPDQAVDSLRLLGHDFPDNPEVLYLTSQVYSDLSTAASQRLLHTAPGSLEAHQLNAEVMELQGRPEAAAKEYRKILDSSPNQPGIHYRLGRLLAAATQGAGTQEDARREFEEELKVNPEDALAEYELGEIARKARSWDEAIGHFSRALSLDPQSASALIGLGKTLLSAGRTPEAVKPLERAVHLEPQNPASHYQLSIAYRRAGRGQEANRETATYEQLHQKEAAAADTVAGGITGKVNAREPSEPPE